jgi:hypothetical protein
VLGAVRVSPRARRRGLHFAPRADGCFGAAEGIGFLRDRLGTRAGKVIVVWDGGTNHPGPLVRASLARTRRRWRERLPPDAPEGNPVEPVGSGLQYGPWANCVPVDRAEWDDAIIDRLIHLRDDPPLRRSLGDGSELPFPEVLYFP